MKTPLSQIFFIWGAFIYITHPLIAAPTVDGTISAADGYHFFQEEAFAQPVNPGVRPNIGHGSATSSDFVGESSGFHFWSSSESRNVTFNGQPRGAVHNIFFAADNTHLYIALQAGTAPFADWGQTDASAANDQGNLYIGIDRSDVGGGTELAANGAGFDYLASGSNRDYQAVDFQGWAPDYIVGLQYMNNGSSTGSGWAELIRTTSGGATNTTIAATGSGGAGTGFGWTAVADPDPDPNNANPEHQILGDGDVDLNGTPNLEGFVENWANYEFRIRWDEIGGLPSGSDIFKVNMYMTQNDARTDTYDSAPGLGNFLDHEEVGDSPGDLDSYNGVDAFDDADGTSFGGSQSGANFVPEGQQIYHDNVSNQDVTFENNFGLVTHADEIDTLEEYYQFTYDGNFNANIPEQSTSLLFLLSLSGLFLRQKSKTS